LTPEPLPGHIERRAMEDRSYWEQRVGTTVRGTWRLESLLGVGGMAAVYVGVQSIGRRDAIKILHPEVARSADLRARFEQEARVLCSFRHPGAVEVLAMNATDDGLPLLVMELLEGESLADRAKRLGGMPHDEMLRYADEVLDVLGAAHAQGIIHRDIKLDNVFITNAGRVKVLDFGIARIRNSPQAVKTRLGSMLGTLPYMPPEQIRGGEIDGRADLFALGAMMFRLMTKRRIHETKTETEMLVKMSTEPAPPVGTIAKDAPTPVCMVVDRALAFRVERRYPDAATMQRDVRAVLRGESPPYATERLAAGDAPNSLIMPAASGPVSVDPTERPTAPPQAFGADAFRDEPTMVGGPDAPGVPSVPTAPASTVGPLSATAPDPRLSAPVPSSPSGASPTRPTPTPAPQTGASIMYAPTMMVSATNAGLSPSPTPAPATPAPLAVPTRAPMPTPAPAPLAPAITPGPSAGHTPPPVANSLIGVAAPQPEARKFKPSLIHVIIAAFVGLVLLFVSIAAMRGHDEPSSETTNASQPVPTSGQESTSPTTTGTSKAGKPKGKRNWNKVNW
jgi:eukaryotic-like serine/threonine-protein kinase